MKYLCCVGAVFLAALVLNGVASTTALARTNCVKADTVEGKPGGDFETSSCEGEPVALVGFVLYGKITAHTKENLFCVEADEKTRGKAKLPYENPGCKGTPTDAGNYTEVSGTVAGASECAKAEKIGGKPGGDFAAANCLGVMEGLAEYVLYNPETAEPLGGGLYCVESDYENGDEAKLPYEKGCIVESSKTDEGRYTKIEMGGGTEPYFRVGTSGSGSELTGTRQATVSTGESHLFVNELGIIITCKSGSGTGTLSNVDIGEIGRMGAIEKGIVKFTECKLEEAVSCVLEAATIEAKEIKGLLGYDGTKVVILLQAEGKSGTFATVKLKSKAGEECAIAGKYEIKGSLIGEIPAADTNALLSSIPEVFKKTGANPNWKQELETFEEPELKEKLIEGHLTYGGHPSSIESTATVSVSGEKLGVFT
jgi:hypothetical protein